ncbi:MAG: O-antigen ligase family protein, partial [bacterium]|nr:O-antigen ligase family protein [bacterium]
LFESGSEKWQALTQLENRSSFASRMMIWQSAGKMIADNPIFGIGLGRFQEVYLEYQKYFPPYLEWAVPQPHNLYFAVWLQTGLMGLIGFTLLIAWVIFLLVKNKSRESALLLGLLTLYLLYGLFDTPFFKTDLAFAFWLVIAFILTLPKPETEFQK